MASSGEGGEDERKVEILLQRDQTIAEVIVRVNCIAVGTCYWVFCSFTCIYTVVHESED